MNYLILIGIVITVIVVWFLFGNVKTESANGDESVNHAEVRGDANTGLPYFNYYHQHRGYIVNSPVMQPRYIENELRLWYDNQQINGVQYENLLRQCREWGFI